MNFEAQCLENKHQLLKLQLDADILLANYHINQREQLYLRRKIRSQIYTFELEQIIQKEKLAYIQFEEKIDHHVKMFTSTLTVDLLSNIDKYVDKPYKWQKMKQQFRQEYETITSLFIIQKKFDNLECENLSLRQKLEENHLSELNNLYIEHLYELNQSVAYPPIMKLNMQQNADMSHFLYCQQNNDLITLKHLKKENELMLVISKIQVKDQIPPFDNYIDYLKDGYQSIQFSVPTLPKIDINLPLENQTIVLEDIYYQFYFIQRELIKMYPKMINIAYEMDNFLTIKKIVNGLCQRVFFLEKYPRVLF